MALYLQFNDDIEHRIQIKDFTENMRQYEENQPIIDYSIEINLKDQDFSIIQPYIVDYVINNSIESLKFFKENDLMYETSRYDKIVNIYLRAGEGENEELICTLRFEELIE